MRNRIITEENKERLRNLAKNRSPEYYIEAWKKRKEKKLNG